MLSCLWRIATISLCLGYSRYEEIKKCLVVTRGTMPISSLESSTD